MSVRAEASRGDRFVRWRWPWPAFAAWSLAWLVDTTLRESALGAVGAFVVAAGLGLAAATGGTTRWRRAFIAAGFPLSYVLVRGGAEQAASVPAWAWLVPPALLLFVYPMRAWSDAPIFPTPRGALEGLTRVAPLRRRARVLDAGCGLGAGLVELRRAYPDAELHGIEWSAPLAWTCRWRCRKTASVRRGDLWGASWAGYDLVYLFQRPESLARAIAKAKREMKPGTWLASLEFQAGGIRPDDSIVREGGKPVWLYRT